MLFANISGEKVEATPRSTATCPLCDKAVISKCGNINVWHWAHQKVENCDNWYEHETEWHKSWKLAFGVDNCEIVINKDNIKHIADVLTKDGIVIELQNSPILDSTIIERERFYGESMIWIINGLDFNRNFSYQPPYFTLGEQWYWRNEVELTEDGYVDLNTGELVTKPERGYTFFWNWPRRSWSYAERKIYIDFGGVDLFMITKGMGSKQGNFKPINKENFLKEHQGNTELLETLIIKDIIDP